MPKPKNAFYVDVTRCIGCRACEIACKEENEVPEGIRWRQVRTVESESQGRPSLYFLSVACNHCEDPICTKVCPTTAMHQREDGVVLVDETKCVGCRYCEWACPYGALHFNANTGHMSKCTFCEHRQADGKAPACVEACPTEALQWGPFDEIIGRPSSTAEFGPLPDAEITKPAIRFKPPRQ